MQIVSDARGIKYTVTGGEITSVGGEYYMIVQDMMPTVQAKAPWDDDFYNVGAAAPGIYYLYPPDDRVIKAQAQSPCRFELHLRVDAQMTVTWDFPVTWQGAGIPVLTDGGKTYVICFETLDGVSWRGNVAYKY